MKGDPLSLIQHSIDPCFNKARSNLNYEQNHFLKQAQHNAERCQCFHAMSNDLTQISQFLCHSPTSLKSVVKKYAKTLLLHEKARIQAKYRSAINCYDFSLSVFSAA